MTRPLKTPELHLTSALLQLANGAPQFGSISVSGSGVTATGGVLVLISGDVAFGQQAVSENARKFRISTFQLLRCRQAASNRFCIWSVIPLSLEASASSWMSTALPVALVSRHL